MVIHLDSWKNVKEFFPPQYFNRYYSFWLSSISCTLCWFAL